MTPFTYILSTDVGKIRLLIPDNKEASYIFEDAEIEGLLSLEGNSVKRAAALALETIASDETMVLKVIKLLDVQTDGAKVADALLKRAAELRKQANDDEVAVDGGFEVAEMVTDQFTYRQHLYNSILRGA